MPIDYSRRVGISQIRQGGFSARLAAAGVVATTPQLEAATRYGSTPYETPPLAIAGISYAWNGSAYQLTSADQSSQEVIPSPSGATALPPLSAPYTQTQSNLTFGNDVRHLVLPYRDDLAVLVVAQNYQGSLLHYRPASNPLPTVPGQPVAPELRFARYSWTWELARGPTQVVQIEVEPGTNGDFGPIPYSGTPNPDLPPIKSATYRTDSRLLSCYVFNNSTIQPISTPSALQGLLDTIYPIRVLNEGAGVRHYNVTGGALYEWDEVQGGGFFTTTTTRQQPRITESTDPADIRAAILGYDYMMVPELQYLWPWRPENRAITGYGINNLFNNLRGWGSGVYSYLDESYPQQTQRNQFDAGLENLLLQDAAAHLRSIGILSQLWLHRFDDHPEPGRFFALDGAAPVGVSPGGISRPWPNGGPIPEDISPWTDSGINFESTPPTDFAINNFPDYNATKLVELGFNLSSLDI